MIYEFLAPKIVRLGIWRMHLRTRFVLAIALLVGSSSAHAVVISHSVDSMDNLYFTDWGHPYNVPPFDLTNVEFGALGTGEPAEVVSSEGLAENFAGFGTVDIVAAGEIAINGSTLWGPDGAKSPLFRGLPVYSLIGVWSRSGSAIDPIGGSFFVGSENSLSVPGGPSAYLWLGFNDGIFLDNLDAPLFGGPGFDIPEITPVPEPASNALLVLGLGFLIGRHLKGGRAQEKRDSVRH